MNTGNAATLRQLTGSRPVAHTRHGWLPQGTGLVGLDELGAEHRRMLGVCAEAGAELHAVRQRFESEDAAKQQALRTSYRDGEKARLPKITPPESREREVAAAEEKLVAVNLALRDFLADAMTEIRRREADWLVQLAERTAEADALREEAARLLAQAEAKVVAVEHMRRWVQRTASGPDHWLIAFDELPHPTPVPQPDLSELGAGAVITHA